MIESRRDILIDRITANEAGDVGFREFELLAADEPASWEQLARNLRNELQLRAALAGELDDAAISEIERAAGRLAEEQSGRDTPLRFRVWGGWAIAAALGMVWIVLASLPAGHSNVIAPDDEPVAQNGGGGVVAVSLSADDALDRYRNAGRAEGRVIEELPAVMVDSRAADDGTLEVLYIRQFLERQRVQSVYELSADEQGNPVPVPVNPAAWDSSSTSL